MVAFWTMVTASAVIWYTITVFIVGVKGFQDVKNMLSAVANKDKK
ncbi:hypothetical protein [Clostridium botulinum]|nr:hypothetical protein [Clostridium botulinum]